MASQQSGGMIDPLEEARAVAREIWHWAVWLNDEMNAAFCVADMQELERLQRDPMAMHRYEEWREFREGKRHRYPWLSEKSR